MRGTNGAVSAQSWRPESFRTVIRVYSESQRAQMWSSVLAAAAAVPSHAQEEGRGTLGGSLFFIYLLDRAAHSQGGSFPSVAIPLAKGLYKHPSRRTQKCTLPFVYVSQTT